MNTVTDPGWYATADEAIAHASSDIESFDGFVIHADHVDDEQPDYHAERKP